MMTVAAAGAAFYWIVKIQGQLQGGTEQYQETTYERMASTVNVASISYVNTTTSLIMLLQNVGTTDILLTADAVDPALRLLLKDSNQTVVCSSVLVGSNAVCASGCNTTLNPTEVVTLNITLGGTCSIATSYSSGTLFYVDLYLSGKGTASSQFKKP